ncbi:hypothetical protein CDD81_4665 [Ophiocordyceps australis]|uniref:DSP-PTPase phosphatase fused to NAD+ Kinase domain-containing protein n=1 Tax=Ophiocordyceps australis TaxID=1399860 RepID=A0A2C5X6Z4_9HYPO|nr:hypothetical protein CDD81_4665 [Ophiocordyceps australis]
MISQTVQLPMLSNMFLVILAVLLFIERISATSNISFALEKRVNEFPDLPPVRECHPQRILKGHGFLNWDWVAPDNLALTNKLARSSAPHYDCRDTDQQLTDESVQFLQSQGITHVISVNSEANNPVIREKLGANGIGYTALPTQDMTTPTMQQMINGYKAFRENTNGATLIWCGYGYGRTGVMVSAFEMFQSAELQLPRDFFAREYKARHIETSKQFLVLNKLQNFLKPAHVAGMIARTRKIIDDAQESVSGITSPGQKTTQQVKNAQARMEAALAALDDLKLAFKVEWQLNRVWFDKSLDLLAQIKSTQPPQAQELIDIFNEVREHIDQELERNAPMTSFAEYITATAGSLQNLMKKLRVAAGMDTPSTESAGSSRAQTPGDSDISRDSGIDTASSSQSVPETSAETDIAAGTDIAAQVEVIESFRKKIHDMYTALQKHVRDVRAEVETTLATSVGPLLLPAMNHDLIQVKSVIDEYAKNGMEATDADDFFAALHKIDQLANNAFEYALNIAQMVNNDEKRSVTDYAVARQAINDIRIKLAEMMGYQAKQYVINYIVVQWQEARDVTENAAKEVSILRALASQLMKPTTEIGGYLDEKMGNVDIIKNIFDDKGESPEMLEYDAPVGVSITGTLWLDKKETAQEALQHELESLMAEINAMKEPTKTLVTMAALSAQEAQLAQAVMLNVDDAQRHIMVWRKEAIRQIVDTLDKQVQDERKAKQELEREQKIEAEDQRLTSERGPDWKLELAIEIGFAVLAIVPEISTPIGQAILWARQAIRVVRFLRNALREQVQVPQELSAQINQVQTRLTDSLKDWKLAAPAATRDWAKSKTPNQIFHGLSELGAAGTKPSKSLKELIDDLEAIEIPQEDPNDEEADKSLERLLKRLNRIEVPIDLPESVKIPELAHLRAPRDFQSLIKALRLAARVPHHSSDVDYMQLIEEAVTYLPSQFDIKTTSMAYQLIRTIRLPAITTSRAI